MKVSQTRPKLKSKKKKEIPFVKESEELLVESTILLADGRSLSYSQFGHQNGEKTVILFPGSPGSRFFKTPQGAAEATNNNCKVFILERPGIGNSSPALVPPNGTLDWCHDLNEFIEKLGIEKFSIVGFSMGGAFALGCAFYQPFEGKLENIYLVSPVTDYRVAGVTDGMCLINRISFFLAHTFPSFFLKVLEWSSSVFADPEKMKDNFSFLMSPSERKFMDGYWWSIFFKDVKEYYKNGSSAQIYDMSALFFSPTLGFDLKSKPTRVTNSIHFYHGTLDYISPVAMSNRVHKLIPGSKITKMKDLGHYETFSKCFPEILKKINGS